MDQFTKKWFPGGSSKIQQMNSKLINIKCHKINSEKQKDRRWEFFGKKNQFCIRFLSLLSSEAS